MKKNKNQMTKPVQNILKNSFYFRNSFYTMC